MMFNIQEPAAQIRIREEVAEKYKWNLKDLYENDQGWEADKNEVVAMIPEIAEFQGKVSESAEKLKKCLAHLTEINKKLYRLYSYASMSSDQDTRVSKYQSMKQQLQQLFPQVGAKSSFLEPEILTLDTAKLDSFIEEEPDLAVYRMYLYDLLRKKAHRGSPGEEKIIADAGLMSGTPYNAFSIFSDAEFPDPVVTLSTGEEVKLNKSNFSLHRASKIQEDRKKVFEVFFTRIGEFENTFGAQLSGNLKRDLFYMKARDYESCLQRALDDNNIPVEVYHNLVNNVNENLDTFHRYLKLRQRMMGVDDLHYYDLYAPLVKEVDLRYQVDEAQNLVLTSLNALGKDYTEVVRDAFRNRWIDMYPNEGKRSGAYSNGVYDVHPYILMNFNGKYDDVSTLTHELGHTMHSYLSNTHQPFPTAQYTIFVAEVASTFNEELLNSYLLNELQDEKAKLSILGNYVESAKGTLFRQTQFAEFELKIHEMIERGEALTGEKLSEIYLEIVKKYYGHDQGVCEVPDYIKYEWAYVPHFYYNFYVYQYATSFTASVALAEKVLNEEPGVKERYLELLKSGGSKYPVDQLKDAGIDMTTSEPFQLTIRKLNQVMDEMEAILNKEDQEF